MTTGVYTVAAIATALYARERSGRGARIDVAMLDSMLSYLEHGFMHLAAFGEAPGRIGNRHPSITPFDTFATADAQIVVCAGDDGLFAKLCAALQRDELARDARFAGNASAHRERGRAQGRARAHAAHARRRELARGAHGRRHSVRARSTTSRPSPTSPQVAARNMLVSAGGVRMPGNPMKIAGYADPTDAAAAPTLDQHGKDIREEFR